MEDIRTAYIYIQKKYAGVLKETDEGYVFTYDKNYLNSVEAIPASITLPLREEEYKSTTLFSFFDGLIPEGWLLEVTIKNWKIDRNDRFGIMLVTCKDSVGDVEVLSEKR
ncbi:MAG: HipA N-terminal domain-containing protein [Lachnospiraceae bacterium]|nr:HipA N-terminal domain-containing protein [Lachnospiraceae bacterium]